MFFDKILDAMNLEQIEANRLSKFPVDEPDAEIIVDPAIEIEPNADATPEEEQLPMVEPQPIVALEPEITTEPEIVPPTKVSPDCNVETKPVVAPETEFTSESETEDVQELDTPSKPETTTQDDTVPTVKLDPADDTPAPFISDRVFIRGLNKRFISVTREIINTGKVIPIALMREFHIDHANLQQILSEAQTAQLLDDNNKVQCSKDFYEQFIEYYEPSLYKCKHCTFDKELLICIGEITLEKGADDLYEEFDADTLLDYLEILEQMHIIKYDPIDNQYTSLVSVDDFRQKCLYIPDTYCRQSSLATVADLDKMEGHKFEHYCADLLRDNGFLDVEVTQESGDHGVDILARKDDITYAIQCKCYSSNSVGNDAVQQANAGKSIYEKDIAVVLTNQYFTQQAKDEATHLGVKLWDRNKLRQFIEHSNTKKK